MLTRVCRYFAFKPTTRIAFENNKCELINEKNLTALRYTSITGTLLLNLGIVYSFGMEMELIYPFGIYLSYIYGIEAFSRRIVKKMYLHDDGIHITIYTIAGSKPRIIKINDISPEEIKKTLKINSFKLFKPFTTGNNTVYLISENSVFTHRNILNEILQGQEITIE